MAVDHSCDNSNDNFVFDDSPSVGPHSDPNDPLLLCIHFCFCFYVVVEFVCLVHLQTYRFYSCPTSKEQTLYVTRRKTTQEYNHTIWNLCFWRENRQRSCFMCLSCFVQ